MFKKVRPLYVINCFWLLNRVLNVGEIVRQVWTNTTKTTQYSRHLEFLRLWRQYTNNGNRGLDEGKFRQALRRFGLRDKNFPRKNILLKSANRRQLEAVQNQSEVIYFYIHIKALGIEK